MKLSGVLIALFLGVVVIASKWNRRIGCGSSPSQSDASMVAMAVRNFQSEYGRLPMVAERVTTDTKDGLKLLRILQGMDLSDAVSQNPRAIRFLPMREARNKRGGMEYDLTGTLVVGLYDDWGNPFTVFLDADGDNALKFKLGSREFSLEGKSVAVVSLGKDGRLGTADDVKSW